MGRVTIRVAVSLLAFLLVVTASIVYLRNQRRLHVLIPTNLERYGLKVLDERAAAAELPKLRTVLLPAGDLEVRVWVGFGTRGEDGLILRRAAGQWSALHLRGMFVRYPPERYQETITLAAPKSGWEPAWRRLVEAGILALPDASSLQCGEGGFDGVHYVVEVNVDDTYRLYSYGNPKHAECDEARKMIGIGRIISEEFGPGAFNLSD